MTEVSEQVERVAKAIADDCDDTWDKLPPEQKDHFRCNAIAAIRALEAAQAGAEQVLRDALQSAAESLHHAGCYVAEAEVLAALTTPSRIEASHPQEAVRKPWYCELPDSVHAEVTKQVREIQAIAIRLDDQEIQVVAEAVYNALIAAALTPPIQAAESGKVQEVSK